MQLFEGARQPAIIISFSPAKPNQDTGKNIIKHITVRPNRFFRYFKTIVIEKHDVKNILQKYFIELKGGNDWLWKVMVHGNILDFYFIKRLDNEFKAFKVFMQNYKLDYKGGLKPVDNNIKPENRKNTSHLKHWDYLEIHNKKEFQPFMVSPSCKWEIKLDNLIQSKRINEDGKVAQLPDIYFFKGKKLLLKNGLSPDFHACSAFSTKNIIFTHSVCSIKPVKGVVFSPEIVEYLQALVGLFNSNLFAYYVFNKGSSAGIERTRANFIDYFSFPTIISSDIAELVMQIQQKYKELKNRIVPDDKNNLESQIRDLKNKLEKKILAEYRITDLEKSLIDYTINVSIPVLKREEGKSNTNIFNTLQMNIREDQNYLKQYANIFINHFGKRFNSNNESFIVDIFITDEFIGIHFKIIKRVNNVKPVNFIISAGIEQILNTIGDLGLYQISKDLYMQQDIRGFKENSFYIIKPNERKLWHKAVAYADLSEFINALVKSEMKKKRKNTF